jgi:uncharacterized protein YegJ (DUF2314 family)
MYKPLPLSPFLLVCLILVASCSPSIVGAPITDEEYQAAFQQAHDTMDILFRAMIAPDPTHRFVGVKARFEGRDIRFEDHWTEPVDYYNNVFTVRILDGLTLNTGLHAEQFANIPAEDILDWIIVESDGNVLGGYTLRLEYDRMTPEQQKEYRENTGYKFK